MVGPCRAQLLAGQWQSQLRGHWGLPRSLWVASSSEGRRGEGPERLQGKETAGEGTGRRGGGWGHMFTAQQLLRAHPCTSMGIGGCCAPSKHLVTDLVLLDVLCLPLLPIIWFSPLFVRALCPPSAGWLLESGTATVLLCPQASPRLGVPVGRGAAPSLLCLPESSGRWAVASLLELVQSLQPESQKLT